MKTNFNFCFWFNSLYFLSNYTFCVKIKKLVQKLPKIALSKSWFKKLTSDSYISHKEFVSISNVLKEYNKKSKKEEIKSSKTYMEYII